MTTAGDGNSNDRPDQRKLPSHRVRLPGFIADEEIGLGDVIKRATSYVGIHACGGCQRRAAALNRWMVFGGSRRK
jgi:hypothetical protein